MNEKAVVAPVAEGRHALVIGRPRVDPWTMAVLLIAGLVALPVAGVVVMSFFPSDGIWDHLADTVLFRYLRTTLGLMAGVGLGTLVIGVGTAWLVTVYRFPGSRVLQWVLLLPMAIPAYVVAYVYTDLLEFAGPVQAWLRGALGWTSPKDYWFPEIRSLGGAITMMTLVLYPYVYLLARAAFLEQSVCALEVARTLGLGPVRSFLKVALPLARPAIVVGVSLVMMETLNDFGTVDFFAVPSLTIGIYDVWLNMNSTAAAAQLCLVLLAFVFGLIYLERLARRRRRFHHTSARYRALPTHDLQGAWAWLASVGCAAPVALGFVLPAALLLRHSLENRLATVMGELLVYGFNSLMLAGASALLAVVIALCLAYGARIRGGVTVRIGVRIAGVGYAIPGAVLGVGLLLPLAAFDNAVDGLTRQLFGISTGLLFSGTIAALVFGYVVRFLALSLGTVEAGLAKITPHMDGVARTLGRGPSRTLWSVHMPIMRGSVLTAALLVFVDGMKELPMTVLLRPFNFDTLATHVHQLASLEQLEQSAPGALAIVGAGILPVIALSRTIRHSRPGGTRSTP